jgi:hypothetical protein
LRSEHSLPRRVDGHEPGSLYRGYAAECLKLAETAFSTNDRGYLLKLSADWSALADVVEKREGEAERMRLPPELEAAPDKPRNRRSARRGSPIGLKVSLLRAHPIQKSRT